MSETKSPLSGLVLCMVCLAIAGSILAGAHYLIIERPAQEQSIAQPPHNGDSQRCTRSCILDCMSLHHTIAIACAAPCGC